MTLNRRSICYALVFAAILRSPTLRGADPAAGATATSGTSVNTGTSVTSGTSITTGTALPSQASASPATDAGGPTPYPKNPKDWPGKGVIRVFPFMSQNRAYFWQFLDRKQGAVVFAGDSLIGNWGDLEKAFPTLNVANRGVGGDVTRGLLFRFKEDILDLHPKAIVLLIGTNDLSALEPSADALSNIGAILDMTAKETHPPPVILCTIPPRDARESPVELPRIQELNAGIAKLAEGRKDVTVLDLFALFATPDGSPDLQYFRPDKLHLAASGFEKWRTAMIPLFTTLKIIVPPPPAPAQKQASAKP